MRFRPFLSALCLAAPLLLSARPAAAFVPHGFFEVAGGMRLGDGRTAKESYSLMEGRMQLKGMLYPERPALLADWGTVFFFKADLLADLHDEEPDAAVRECYVQLSPLGWLDVKAGRQIVTWGIGDLIFINDLFPKDYVSFFIGRDDEYLKAPADALKLSFYSPLANFDLVVMPLHRPDEPIRGRRVSLYNPFARKTAGDDEGLYFNKPAHSLKNTELAVRLHRMLGGMELALYWFRGFYKVPAEVGNIFKHEVKYPELSVYGASLRGPLWGGIAWSEFGWYRSREDAAGRDPRVDNSALKYLTGYEYQFKNDLYLALQYYGERMLDYGDYKEHLLRFVHRRDEYYSMLLMRVTRLCFQQDLELSLFVYYSPSDDDWHVRPRVTWDVTDRWKLTAGANLFGGEDDFTQLGQFRRNDIAYLRVRYSF